MMADPAGSFSDEEHFLIYVRKDDSFNLVPKSDVICDASVNRNDLVLFHYYSDSGKKTEYEGVVKEISFDLTFLERRMHFLNKNRSKTPPKSSRERKSKLNCMDQLKSVSRGADKDTSHRKRKGNKENTAPEMEHRKRVKNMQSVHKGSRDSDSDVPSDCSDSDSGPEVSLEELARREKLSKERRKSDLKKLAGMNSSFISDKSVDVHLDSTPVQSTAQLIEPDGTSRSPGPLRIRLTSSSDSALERSFSDPLTAGSKVNDSSDSSPSPPPKKVSRPNARRPRYEKLVFQGEYFKCKKDDERVVQLHPGYEVYVKEDDLKVVKRDSKTGPMMARLLLKAIYSKEATTQCSPTGRPSGVKKERRPPLHPDGIHSAHGAINKRGLKKHWPTVSLTNVKKAFSDILCEDRYAARLLEANQAKAEVANA